MPPFASTNPPVSRQFQKRPASSRPTVVTLNVGGQIFQTTPETLALAGPTSLLADPPPFIDRDPHLFSLLLSLLRSRRLPPAAPIAALIAEARFFNLDPSLLPSAASSSPHFDPFSLRRSLALPLTGRDLPSALAADPSGAVHVAHGGKITSFDWSLTHKSTVLTRFPAVDSLLPLGPSLVAAGAVDFEGLQILDLTGPGSVKKTLYWNPNPGSGSGSAVQAIGSSPDFLFTSFESIRRNASTIALFDRANLKAAGEVGRKEIYGAELDTAIPATKLKWVDGYNLLLASGSHAGPSGLTGNVRLWDLRSAKPVWEVTEKADCFADVSVSDRLSAVYKVGANSGDLFMCDLRKLRESEPWVGVEEGKWRERSAAAAVGRAGSGCLVECYGEKVFVSRGGDVEVWSEIVMGGGMRWNEDGVVEGERVMKRNLMGRREDLGGKRIMKLGFGGKRMVVVRKEEHHVEVWESCSTSSSSSSSRV